MPRSPIKYPVPPADSRRDRSDASVNRAGWAVFAAYTAMGYSIGTIASRIPAIRTALGLNSAQTGWLLVVWAAGSVLALPLSGLISGRLGSVRTVGFFAFVVAAGHLLLASSAQAHGLILTAIGLLIAGAGQSIFDAANTLEAALVERRLGYAAIPRFQAGESLGILLGSGVGALFAATAAPLVAHFAINAVLATTVALIAVRSFLTGPRLQSRDFPKELAELGATTRTSSLDSDEPAVNAALASNEPSSAPPRQGLHAVLAAWREPRTLLLGVVILGAALAEGAAGDWTAVAVVSGFGQTQSVGALALAVFYTAMLSTRLAAPSIVDRIGRVAALRACAAATLVGVSLFSLSPWLPLALLGSFIWGFSAALGFPLGVSAAADDPRRAPMRVAVVTTIGYCAYIIGPAVIGELSERLGYRNGLLFLVVPAVIGLLVAGAAKPTESASAPEALSFGDWPQASPSFCDPKGAQNLDQNVPG